MADIYHQIGVVTGSGEIYSALTTTDGLSSWWAPASGTSSTGGKLLFHFGEHQIEMTVRELVPDKKVVWQCTEQEGEWKDTLIEFELLDDGEQVFINFAHRDWAEQTSLCSHCSTKWAVFLLSLKDYLEKGKGRPFPEDTHINHTDF